MTKKEQTITEDEVKKEFKLLKEKGAQLKKDLKKLERRRKGAGIGLQGKGGIKEELETLELLGRTISVASSSFSKVSDLLHTAAVEITKDGMVIKDLLGKNPKAAKEYKRILEEVKKIYSKGKKEKSVAPEDTLDALANLLDRYLETLEKELEEKKAPAVPKKPAPKPEEAPEEKPEEKKAAEAAPPDYKSMSWSDLQKLASNRGLKVVGAGVKKDKVIADLKAMDKGEVVARAEEKKAAEKPEEKKAPAVPKKPAPKPEEAPEEKPEEKKGKADFSAKGRNAMEELNEHIETLEKELEEKKAPKVEKPKEETKKEKVTTPSSAEKIKLIEEKRKEKIEEAIVREKAEEKAKAPAKKPAPKAKKAAKKPAKKKVAKVS